MVDFLALPLLNRPLISVPPLPFQARSNALLRSNQGKDRAMTELREGSKILEDQLRLMDEKVLSVHIIDPCFCGATKIYFEVPRYNQAPTTNVSLPTVVVNTQVCCLSNDQQPVSYTHLTLPTKA